MKRIAMLVFFLFLVGCSEPDPQVPTAAPQQVVTRVVTVVATNTPEATPSATPESIKAEASPTIGSTATAVPATATATATATSTATATATATGTARPFSTATSTPGTTVGYWWAVSSIATQQGWEASFRIRLSYFIEEEEVASAVGAQGVKVTYIEEAPEEGYVYDVVIPWGCGSAAIVSITLEGIIMRNLFNQNLEENKFYIDSPAVCPLPG